MAIKKLSKDFRENYITMLMEYGEDNLYKRVSEEGFLLDKVGAPNNILDYSESFFALYVTTGKEEYFTIGKVLRRAAHAIYRALQRKNDEKLFNKRFLNQIK
jgi:hypothetical protein